MKKPLLNLFWIFSGLVLLLHPHLTNGQAVSLTTLGSAYTQNFNTLSNTAGSTTNNLTITGWFMTETGNGALDNDQYAVGTGSSNTGDTYSYGSANSTDRALGGLRSGTLVPVFGAAFTNNTGTTINNLQISYTGEQWRLGTEGRTDKLNFQYSLNATDLNTGTWTSIAALDFVSAVTATAGPKDGNNSANRTLLSTAITGLSIPNGATFWIRWTDEDVAGSEDGLAVDDFSLTPLAVVPTSLSIDDVSLIEGNSGATIFNFTVSLSAPAPAGGVTFDIATIDGTASSPGDYTAKSLTSQTIPAGNSTYSFNVLAKGDVDVESDETFFVIVTSVTNAIIADGLGVGTIVNDDLPPNLSIDDVSLIEGNSGTTSFNFTVSLSAPAPAGGITFDIATLDGTSTAPGDYTAKSLTSGTIPAGSSVYTFMVLVNGDTSFEPDETFFVNVTNVTNANITDGQGVGTIVNDDAAPNLTINDVSLNEGNSGTTTFNFTASLSAPAPAGGVTFNILTADGAAIAPGDYTSAAGTVTIPQGVSTGSFVVLVNGDTSVEPDETFFVNVTNATNANITDGQGVGTIVNDDLPPNLSIDDVSLIEGNSGATSFNFTVSLSAPAPAGGVTFDIATVDGTASSPGDYTAKSLTSQAIPAGSSTYTFNVLVNGDVDVESDETFFVNVTNATNANITDGLGIGTIVNDDVAPPILATLSGNSTVCSGQSATVTVVVTNGNSPYSLTISDGSSSIPVSGYVSGAPIVVTTNSTATYTISALSDATSTSASPENLSGTATVTVDVVVATLSPSEATINCSRPVVSLTATGGTSYTLSDGQTNTTGVFSVSTSGPYTVTVASASGCTATATATITIDNSVPEVRLEADGILSCAVPSVTLTAYPFEQINYVFSEGAMQMGRGNIASVTQAGTYSVIVTGYNGCTATASITVESEDLTPMVSIDPSSATLSCGVTSVTLEALAEGQLVWSTGEMTQMISVTAAGVYSVTVSDGNGCSATATAEVYQNNNAPSVSISPSSATLNCANPSVTLTANGSGTYRWSTGENTASISVNTAGAYSVTVTGGNSCTATASVQVSQDSNAPTVSISPSSATLNCANPSVTLTANGSGTYRWSTGENTASISVNTAGTYSVTVTGGNTCTATASVQVSQDSNAPTVSISPSSATLNCANPSVTLTANGSGTYRWSTGATSQTISVSSAGTYSVTITGGNSCTATASVQVSQDSNAPTVSISPSSATLNCANPSVTLTANGSGTYRWSTGATSQTISVSSAGTYSVTVTGGNSCTATASVQVSQDSNAPTVSISPSSATLSCANPSVTLTANGSGTYRWSTGENTASISVNTAGTYSVTVTGGNTCTATASVQVSQDSNAPTVSISPSSATLNCANPSVTLTANGSGTYRWSTGENTASISVNTAGTYSVTVTGGNSCTATASVQVSQDSNAPSVSISPSSATLNCANPSVTLTANGSGTYRWSTGATSQTISVSSAGTYSVTVTGGNNCTATASVQVSQDSNAPTVSISPSSATLSCANPSVTLTANGSGTYQWSTGATSQTISVSSAGTYSVTVTGGNTCTATASVQISQDSNAPSVSISAMPSLTIGSGQSTTLTASGATTYRWSTGENTASIVVNSVGIYSVTGTTGNCTAQAFVTIYQTTTPTGPFAITAVTTNTCTQISNNRYVISFTPQYSGVNGQPISVSVTNEMFPTTAPGPYTLQLYNDNPTIVVRAQQGGTPGETSYTYNWLANCRSPQPNTPPRVSQPLTDQVARVGQAFGYTIPQNTFTDNESPHTLVLSVTGLPAGLSFSPPTQIGGVPSMTGVSTVRVTATDPQGLSVSTSFVLTVVDPSATNTPPVLVNPIASQVAIQGQPFGLNVGNAFTDDQTPNALTLAATGLPVGLNLVGTTISGTPSTSGTSTITLTATDPGGLTASSQFTLSVQPSSTTASTPFSIVGVSPLACTQISNNRYEISFQPQYSGLNGQPVSLSVVNEMFPTTAPGPYSLQLYNDNPTIILKAMQQGSPGEASYTYNWLANCRSPQPNTPPRVSQPLTDQVARVGQAFGYTIPQNTFTDNESPHTLVLSVTGLPAGLSFSPPTQIGGVPSMTGVSTVRVTATDPQGLSVSTSFVLTVNSANAPNPGQFSMTGVQTISCETINGGLKLVRFTPQYSNVNGQPILFSVVNELVPTTAPGPYTLQLYTDNPVITLKATQQGSLGEAIFSYNWLAACANPSGRQGVGEQQALRVTVLGNPVAGEQLEVEVQNGQGQFVNLTLVNEQGRAVSQVNKLLQTNAERVQLTIGANAGVYLLQVSSPVHQETIKLLKR